MNALPVVEARPARILVVDDERDNRDLLEIVLTSEGFMTTTAADGIEALASVALEPPDLVLLDIMMPGMNGYQVVETLKAQASTRQIVVVMLTALTDNDTKQSAFTAGADDFLSKPLDRAQLCKRIRQLLGDAGRDH
jgi:CheY-like chemotaxis protein